MNKNRLKKTTKTETLDLNQIWVYIKHNLGVVLVFWFFWYLYHNERLKLHCKRAHLFVSYFVFFFSNWLWYFKHWQKKFQTNMYMLGTFPGMLRWMLKKLAACNVETSDLNFQSGYLQSNDAQTVTKWNMFIAKIVFKNLINLFWLLAIVLSVYVYNYWKKNKMLF